MADAKSQEEKARSINSNTRPTVALPARPAFEESPGPLTLASSLFPGEADEVDANEPNCSSYTQLLIGTIGGASVHAGAAAGAAAAGNNRVENDRGRMGAGIMTSQQQQHFLLSPGFSPTPFLDSPGFYQHQLVSYFSAPWILISFGTSFSCKKIESKNTGCCNKLISFYNII